jgi:hypothetical protein
MTALMLRVSAYQDASEQAKHLLNKPQDAQKRSHKQLDNALRASSDGVKEGARSGDENRKLLEHCEGTESRKRKNVIKGKSKDGTIISMRGSNKSSLEEGWLSGRPVCGSHTPGSDDISWRIFP